MNTLQETHPSNMERFERAFATLYGRVRSMLNQAGLSKTMRDLMWTEAAATATKLENILVDKKDYKSPHELIYGKTQIIQNTCVHLERLELFLLSREHDQSQVG